MGFMPDKQNRVHKAGDIEFQEIGSPDKLGPEAKAGFDRMTALLRPAHAIMRGLLQKDSKLIDESTKVLSQKLIDSGITNKEDQVAFMSLIIAAAGTISPRSYGEDDSWGRQD